MNTNLTPYNTALKTAAEAGTLPPLGEFSAFLTGTKLVVRPTTEVVSTILTFTPFTVPKGATVEILKEGFSMSNFCRTNLTTANFGTTTSTRPVQGGFLPMGKQYKSEEAVEAVKDLMIQTDRNLRLGTPKEFLAFKKQGCLHPKWCVSLAKVWNHLVLYWDAWANDDEFLRLHAWPGKWGAYDEIFIVEDL